VRPARGRRAADLRLRGRGRGRSGRGRGVRRGLRRRAARTVARLMDRAREQAARHLMELAGVAERAAALAPLIAEAADHASAALGAGGKLLFCGNGGSAADAQHLATEYVVRFQRAGRALAAIALTTDTSLLTAA